MFARATATITQPAAAVAAILTAPGHPWRVALDGNGGELLAKVGITVGRIPVYKHVQLTVGPTSVTSETGRAMLPVEWEAIGGPPIFPKMEGTLHVEPDGPRMTNLTLNARYDPPMGDLGRLIERVLMHRVAQMTMNNFIERLAGALSAELEG
jgi:hypothetical protein